MGVITFGWWLPFFLCAKEKLMALYQVAYDRVSRVALIQADNAAVPAGSVDVGSFEHPEPITAGSKVVFHNVRDLLYKRSAADPANMAMFPENITDMDNVAIQLDDGLTSDDLVVITHLAFQQKQRTIEKGQKGYLNLDYRPTNVDITDRVTYTSSDETVGTVNKDGVFEALSGGQTVITASTTVGDKTIEDEMTVTVI